MNKFYDVEVPTYLRVRVAATSPEAASTAAESLVQQFSEWPTKIGHYQASPDADVIETQLLLLDEDQDRTPDIYEVSGALALR